MTIICSLLGVNCFAQLVSVECCYNEDDLLKIGYCTSGPDGTQLPETCRPPGNCMLAFGANTGLMALLCTGGEPQLPDGPRAMCSSWVLDQAPVVDECIASPLMELNLFTTYDADRDGDLDLVDVAAFQELFHELPNPTQSDAMLVRVECCSPEASLLSLGLCLSGPGVINMPPECDSQAACTLGFSDAVQVGDFPYRLCRPESTTTIGPSDFFCSSWTEEDVPSVQSCQAADAAGVGTWLVFDDDGDGDLDLADFANLQRILESPRGR